MNHYIKKSSFRPDIIQPRQPRCHSAAENKHSPHNTNTSHFSIGHDSSKTSRHPLLRNNTEQQSGCLLSQIITEPILLLLSSRSAMFCKIQQSDGLIYQLGFEGDLFWPSRVCGSSCFFSSNSAVC